MSTTIIVPQCHHRKDNGIRCGSPALRGRDFCYFHDRQRRDHPTRRPRTNTRYRDIMQFRALDNRQAIHDALIDTVNRMMRNEIEAKDATALIYALQTAIQNL
ncbi:MAG TPA: hypothetical protein VD837_16245 [Terriglobales bacterium]|nr:hypothetical protein [Terriglobales bacterium]